jgi:FkbM family methyltransferase
MITMLRKLAGSTLRKAGWERKSLYNPLYIENALGHELFAAELGILYKNFDNRSIEEFDHGDIWFARQIKAGQTVLDVGANVGFYTLLYAKQTGPHGKVIAFEPGPKSFKLLSRNVAMNGYENVTLVNKAVSNKSGMTRFYICRTGESDNRLVDASQPGDIRDPIDVEMVTLDEVFPIDPVDVIKMDIQGAEYMAWQGMTNLITRNKDIKIQMEFAPHCLAAAKTDPAEFLRYMRSFGFRIHVLYDDKPMEETTDSALLAMVGEGKAFSYVDLVLFR